MSADAAPCPSGAAQELLAGAGQLAARANDTLNGLADAAGVTPVVKKKPYGAVAAAFGVGYVVGGGLFTPTTARLLRLGLRVAALPLVRDRLLDVAERLVDEAQQKQKSAAAPSQSDGER
jgi:hypothetical protein